MKIAAMDHYGKPMGNVTDSILQKERDFSNGRYLVKKESMIPFFLLLFYLFMEYGRPQSLLPFLRIFRLSGITVALLALYVVFSGKVKFKEKQTLLYMFLLGQMIIHGPIAVNNYWALMVFIGMTMNFVVFLSLIHFVDSQEKYEKLINIWLGIHVFLAVMGILKQGKGIGGFLGDENDLCMTLNMIIPFSFFLSLDHTGRKRVFYLVLTCLFLFAIIITQSRGGFVGLIATGIYCWLRTKRKFISALIIGILAVFAVIMAPPQYWDEVRSITEQGTSKGTGEARVYTWTIGWHIFLDNPIMGVGQGNFPWVFGEYEKEVTGSDEPFHGRSVAGRMAHSIYFTMLPELGLIGTFTILAMIYYCFKDLNLVKKRFIPGKKNKVNVKAGTGIPSTKLYHIALALEGSLISYLVSSSFISTLYYPNLWILMGFIVSLNHIVIQDLKLDTA
jgi:O-antigen ligase